jgi:protein Tex
MSLALIPRTIATEIGATPQQVSAAVELLDGGATVPFIARYRKEVTGGLDDTQLRRLEERLGYLRELEARRGAILASITEQGKLTEDLAKAITKAVTKAELEDIYLPYKPKRRTKAMIAREAGLQGLLDAILADRAADPLALAGGFLSEGFADAKAALEGARDILAEGLSEDAALLGRLRDHMRKVGKLAARVVAGKEAAGAKFSDYFAHTEDLSRVPSHRALAMFRGRNEEVLTLDLEVDAEAPRGESPAERACAAAAGAGNTGPGDKWLREAAAWAWRVKLKTSLTLDLMSDLREAAEAEAIRVFARNLKDLLLAAPAGGKATMGLDPGIRTGVKVAVVDGTGKVLETDTVYPFQPKNDLRGAQVTLARLIGKHGVKLISIGNGTASRETEKMVADILAVCRAKSR